MQTLEQALTAIQNLTNSKISQEEFGKVLGTGRSNINRRIKNKSKLTFEEMKKLEKAYNVELNNSNKGGDYICVPVRGDVVASMGNGVEVYNESQTGMYQLGSKLLKDIGVNKNKCEMIFASGDSMYPTIEGGDSLLIDTSKTEIHDGNIYCVRIDGQLYAKRLQKIPPNKIKVVSDNSAKYDAFYIDFTEPLQFDFSVIGEIKWWGRVAK